MGILGDLGVTGLPTINITGFLSSTWIYVAVVVLIGLFLIAAVGIILFLITFNRRVEFYENISGRGYQRVVSTRARVVKLGKGGEEILKTLIGGYYLSAHGQKMGKNLYWFAKGSDGFFYNVILGDLDTQQNILDIEPIERDVRFFQVALDRMSKATYDKVGWFEKHSVHILLFLFLVVLILGMWFIVGKIGEAVAPLAQSAESAMKVQEANIQITSRLDSIARSLGITSLNQSSGLISAPT